jgi:hypothetical protein
MENRFGIESPRYVVEGHGALYNIDHFIFTTILKFTAHFKESMDAADFDNLEKELQTISTAIDEAKVQFDSESDNYDPRLMQKYIKAKVFNTKSIYDLIPSLPERYHIPEELLWSDLRGDTRNRLIAFSSIASLLMHMQVTDREVKIIILIDYEDEICFARNLPPYIKYTVKDKKAYLKEIKPNDMIISSDLDYLKGCKGATNRTYVGTEKVEDYTIQKVIAYYWQ